ncbi:MAG: DinB family protein [Planctomycetota bacterium]|jgi:predicted MPP superfamily phosphohydrolase
MSEFEEIGRELLSLIEQWEPKLLALGNDVISERRNSQNRTVKQLVGHMVDSASNNTHRIVHLQYQPSPLIFPCYATHGNNDRWIAIQNYQQESWNDLVQLWKYAHIHIVHVMGNINADKVDNVWMSGHNEEVSLEEMVVDFRRHFKLHLDEIGELIDQE